MRILVILYGNLHSIKSYTSCKVNARLQCIDVGNALHENCVIEIVSPLLVCISTGVSQLPTALHQLHISISFVASD